MSYFILSFIILQVLLQTVVERIAIIFFACGEIIQFYILCASAQNLLDAVSFTITHYFYSTVSIIALEILQHSLVSSYTYDKYNIIK